MNDMSNLLMLLIAAGGGGLSAPPVTHHVGWQPIVTRQHKAERTDFVLCRDGQFHAFAVGQPKPCA
ncbi:TPA: hypothetical protein QDB15_004195 [Burkholderia vietnamiensis]|uniref:Uncharacterized protein n=1 Tax=Burkholderia vietnamiensis TaxID=60552 RepID=A0AA44XXU5_BURVI|nr:hypothetical protein [Burkholderia vietnamiensis]KVS09444.1 hypothetical protein WK29_21050 [Burkholderia vietnamiensis]KVS16105.1 hypothetical protein WK32_27745 [Burkholderia vietnamiensis]MCA8210951.1 hypothetical protein [Burkholderia vietnamiensis]MDN7820216.1 hypothetical protein [Burkholderia vietnamiensis]PRH40623.1 hypothetical protein C6T65_19995 [Burkholderia vietnamiensis]